MKFYKTLATNKRTGKAVLIESDYNSKAEFIQDVRANGYRVSALRVKEAHVYDWIIKNTDCTPQDFRNGIVTQ